jgi:chromosome segregation ATPase
MTRAVCGARTGGEPCREPALPGQMLCPTHRKQIKTETAGESCGPDVAFCNYRAHQGLPTLPRGVDPNLVKGYRAEIVRLQVEYARTAKLLQACGEHNQVTRAKKENLDNEYGLALRQTFIGSINVQGCGPGQGILAGRVAALAAAVQHCKNDKVKCQGMVKELAQLKEQQKRQPPPSTKEEGNACRERVRHAENAVNALQAQLHTLQENMARMQKADPHASVNTRMAALVQEHTHALAALRQEQKQAMVSCARQGDQCRHARQKLSQETEQLRKQLAETEAQHLKVVAQLQEQLAAQKPSNAEELKRVKDDLQRARALIAAHNSGQAVQPRLQDTEAEVVRLRAERDQNQVELTALKARLAQLAAAVKAAPQAAPQAALRAERDAAKVQLQQHRQALKKSTDALRDAKTLTQKLHDRNQKLQTRILTLETEMKRLIEGGNEHRARFRQVRQALDQAKAKQGCSSEQCRALRDEVLRLRKQEQLLVSQRTDAGKLRALLKKTQTQHAEDVKQVKAAGQARLNTAQNEWQKKEAEFKRRLALSQPRAPPPRLAGAPPLPAPLLPPPNLPSRAPPLPPPPLPALQKARDKAVENLEREKRETAAQLQKIWDLGFEPGEEVKNVRQLHEWVSQAIQKSKGQAGLKTIKTQLEKQLNDERAKTSQAVKALQASKGFGKAVKELEEWKHVINDKLKNVNTPAELLAWINRVQELIPRYTKLKQKIKELENIKAAANVPVVNATHAALVARLKADAKAITGRIKDERKEQKERETALEKLTATLKLSTDEKRALQEQLRVMKGENVSLTTNLKTLEGKFKAATDTLKQEHKQQLEEVYRKQRTAETAKNQEIERLKTRLANSTGLADKVKAQHAQQVKRLEDSMKQLQAELTTTRGEVNRLTAELNQTSAKLTQTQTELAQLRVELNKGQRNETQLKNAAQSLQKINELQGHIQKFEQAEKQQAKLVENLQAQLATERSESEQKVQTSQGDLKKAQERVQKLQQEAQQEAQKAQELQRKAEQTAQRANERAREALQAAEEARRLRKETTKDRAKTPQRNDAELTQARENERKAREDAVKAREDAVQAQADAKRARDEVVQIKATAQQAQGTQAQGVKERLETAQAKQREAATAARLAREEANQIRQQAQASRTALEKTVERKRAQLANLQEENRQLQNSVKQAQGKIQTQMVELNARQRAGVNNAELQRKLNEAQTLYQKQLATGQQTSKRYREEYESVLSGRKALKDELKRLQGEVREQKKVLEAQQNLKQLNTTLTQTVASLEKNMATNVKNVQELQDKLEKAQAKANQAVSSSTQAVANTKQAAVQANKQAATIKAAQEELRAMKALVDTQKLNGEVVNTMYQELYNKADDTVKNKVQKLFNNNDTTLKKLQVMIQVLTNSYATIKKERRETQAAEKKAVAQLNAAEASLKDIRTQKEQAEATLNQLKIKHAALNTQAKTFVTNTKPSFDALNEQVRQLKAQLAQKETENQTFRNERAEVKQAQNKVDALQTKLASAVAKLKVQTQASSSSQARIVLLQQELTNMDNQAKLRVDELERNARQQNNNPDKMVKHLRALIQLEKNGQAKVVELDAKVVAQATALGQARKELKAKAAELTRLRDEAVAAARRENEFKTALLELQHSLRLQAAPNVPVEHMAPEKESHADALKRFKLVGAQLSKAMAKAQEVQGKLGQLQGENARLKNKLELQGNPQDRENQITKLQAQMKQAKEEHEQLILNRTEFTTRALRALTRNKMTDAVGAKGAIDQEKAIIEQMEARTRELVAQGNELDKLRKDMSATQAALRKKQEEFDNLNKTVNRSRQVDGQMKQELEDIQKLVIQLNKSVGGQLNRENERARSPTRPDSRLRDRERGNIKGLDNLQELVPKVQAMTEERRKLMEILGGHQTAQQAMNKVNQALLASKLTQKRVVTLADLPQVIKEVWVSFDKVTLSNTQLRAQIETEKAKTKQQLLTFEAQQEEWTRWKETADEKQEQIDQGVSENTRMNRELKAMREKLSTHDELKRDLDQVKVQRQADLTTMQGEKKAELEALRNRLETTHGNERKELQNEISVARSELARMNEVKRELAATAAGFKADLNKALKTANQEAERAVKATKQVTQINIVLQGVKQERDRLQGLLNDYPQLPRNTTFEQLSNFNKKTGRERDNLQARLNSAIVEIGRLQTELTTAQAQANQAKGGNRGQAAGPAPAPERSRTPPRALQVDLNPRNLFPQDDNVPMTDDPLQYITDDDGNADSDTSISTASETSGSDITDDESIAALPSKERVKVLRKKEQTRLKRKAVARAQKRLDNRGPLPENAKRIGNTKRTKRV